MTIPAGDATTLYGLLRRGQEYVQVNRYVLQNTFTTNNPTEARIAIGGVNKVWSTNQIFSAYASIPATLKAAINEIPPKSASGYAWGWLKNTPTLQKSFDGLTSIVTEWTLELWLTQTSEDGLIIGYALA